MNTVDALILILIVFNLLIGTFRGAVWQILRIGAIVLGLWVAARFGDDVVRSLPASFGLDDGAGAVVVKVVLFLSVYLVMYGVTNLARALIDKAKLGSADRLVGALLGSFKGVAFACLLLYLQFVPGVRSLGVVRDHLDGNKVNGTPPSISNRIFLAYMKERIEDAVPAKTHDRVRDLSERLEDELIKERGR